MLACIAVGIAFGRAGAHRDWGWCFRYLASCDVRFYAVVVEFDFVLPTTPVLNCNTAWASDPTTAIQAVNNNARVTHTQLLGYCLDVLDAWYF